MASGDRKHGRHKDNPSSKMQPQRTERNKRIAREKAPKNGALVHAGCDMLHTYHGRQPHPDKATKKSDAAWRLGLLKQHRIAVQRALSAG